LIQNPYLQIQKLDARGGRRPALLIKTPGGLVVEVNDVRRGGRFPHAGLAAIRGDARRVWRQRTSPRSRTPANPPTWPAIA